MKILGVRLRSITCLYFCIKFQCPSCGNIFTEEEFFSVEQDRDVCCPACSSVFVRRQKDLRDAYTCDHELLSFDERREMDRVAYAAISLEDAGEDLSLEVESVNITPLLGKSLVTILMDALLEPERDDRDND